MENIEAGLQLTMSALQKEVGASKSRACDAVVVPIIFKGETRSVISESKQRLGDLTMTTKALPSTIQISSRQVRHIAKIKTGGSRTTSRARARKFLLK